MKFDCSGYATKSNVKCSDGRVIMKDAFKEYDGRTVPLVWNHQHDDPLSVLGHAMLENRDDGLYAYCKFNNTESGRSAKILVESGDVSALSIYANQLKQRGANVLHGAIREVSLVLAGANPEALIDSVICHADESGTEAIIYSGTPLELSHSDESSDNDVDSEDGETIADVLNTLTEKQKNAVAAVVSQALSDGGETDDEEENKNDSEGGDKTMKHNLFDKDDQKNNSDVLSHSDQAAIIEMAKTSPVGTFQNALQIYADENDLQHDAISSGFVQTGEGNVSMLFPEYKDVRPGAPELLTNDQGWISIVLNKVHKSPISRIRTSHVDIRNINGIMDSLRARGYVKGKKKLQTGNIKLLRRSTDPQTVYVKSALHRDDITDIVDFDYVAYLYNIDKMQLNEELATAIMLGDGRDDADEGKIFPEHIRPIWLDDDLYTLHMDIDLEAAKTELQGAGTGTSFGENYIMAEAMINTVLYARERYKGSGIPDMFITPHMLNVMLLARDMNGRRIYSSVSELASAFNVEAIHTAEQFEGKTRKTDANETKELVALIVNLSDYSLGATKGGEITHFTQFDIDFNQQKSLLETRCSGALTRVYSAIAIEKDVTTGNQG